MAPPIWTVGYDATPRQSPLEELGLRVMLRARYGTGFGLRSTAGDASAGTEAPRSSCLC